MVSRCVSSIDSVNDAASFVYNKHKQRDIYNVAAENLRRISKEKSKENGKERKRNASAPANLLPGRITSRKNLTKEDRRRTESESTLRLPTFADLRKTNLKGKGAGIKSPQVERGGTKISQRSKSTEQKGKIPMNRYVKEMLNKIEVGCYVSEWSNFSGVRNPPKWIDFHTGDNKGVLDAFICKSPEGKQSSCYLINMREGERMAELMKYPQKVRVGKNGFSNEPSKKKDSTWILEECQEVQKDGTLMDNAKERTMPLSWSEQLNWKNAKIITPK